ncbi:hypothetical protein QJS10_CPB15g00211 [Acorus calamus]|uniref:Homoserine kinase n=1 Tax=Acorus calamus TaxID=4465 RepID=A0AAV9D6E0_ACOCL|nr:hypothetical protein QJS10_CPB15g00211 [Acorus calamus]
MACNVSNLPASLDTCHHPRVSVPLLRRSSTVRCSSSSPKTLNLKSLEDPSPLFRSLTAFAPATVANLGPGFDVLGCAVDGIGDHVTVSLDPSVPRGTVRIDSITGGSGVSRLSRNPNFNCAGIAAVETLRRLGVRSVGLSLSLEKGLPLGSGLGSSAASAAAAAAAVNGMFGGELSHHALVLAGLESEARVSGRHADNIAPAIMGGFVLIRGYQPLDLHRLEFPDHKELFFVLASPEFEAPTKKMREALPREVAMAEVVHNSAQVAALVAAVLGGDARGVGSAMSADVIVEPRRAPLIPGMAAVKAAAVKAGAFGCTISGAGPTAVAVTDDEEMGREIGERMVEAFWRDGKLKAAATVRRLDRVGARVVGSED